MKPAVLAAAVALTAFLVVRRRKLEPTLLIGGALGVLALAVYGSGLVHLPNVKSLVEDLGSTLGQWTYVLVGVMAFFETGAFVGLLAPGETFLIFGGVVAGQGTISLAALIAIVWTAAVLGDLASFYAGRRLGRVFLVKHGPKVSITEERLETVEAFFARHGGKAVLLGRFVGLIRAILPFLAGSSGMALRRFLPYDVIGAGAWATALLTIGYVFWQSFDRVLHYAERGTLALGTTIVAVSLLVWAYRRLRDPAQRRRLGAWVDAQLDRPALRPLAVVVRPAWRLVRRPLRFVWQRLTPGDLGLEVTTLLAFAVVGGFAFIASGMSLDGDAALPGDRAAFTAAGDLRAATLNDVAKVVTELGTTLVVGVVSLVVIGWLAIRGRAGDAAVLAIGTVTTWAAVQIARAAFDRPAPAGPLVESSGQAFPSSHAAYAVAWVAMAVVLTRPLAGVGRTTLAVVAAGVLAAVVGLTRIYLRAQHLSDVVAGSGLAVAIFGLCGVGALVVAHVRHNAVQT